MNTLSDKIINYAKDVNNHGNGVIYYKNKDHGQYEMAASFFSHAIGDLYNIVYQNGGKTLINCPDDSMKALQSYKISATYGNPCALFGDLISTNF